MSIRRALTAGRQVALVFCEVTRRPAHTLRALPLRNGRRRALCLRRWVLGGFDMPAGVRKSEDWAVRLMNDRLRVSTNDRSRRRGVQPDRLAQPGASHSVSAPDPCTGPAVPEMCLGRA